MNLKPAVRFIAGQAVYVFADGSVLPRVAGADGPAPDVLPEEIAGRLSRLAELPDEDLAELEADLQTYLDSVVDPVEAGEAEATDEIIAAAAAARDAINQVRADAERRYTEAAEADAEAERRRAELAAIRDEVAPADEEDEDDEEGEGETETAPAETPPAEPAEPEAETPPAEEAETPAPVAVAANAAPAPAPYPRPGYRPPLERVAARRRRQERPRQTTSDRPSTTLTAAADLRGFGAGQALDLEQLAVAIVERADALRFVSPGANGMKYPVAQARSAYAEERRLSRDNAVLSTERLDAAMGDASPGVARVASGGICAPAMPDYTVLGISDDSRPARSSLANFEAPRGAVTTMAPPRFHRGMTSAELTEDSNAHDFSKGVGKWDAANDVALNNPATKPIAKVDCEETTTTTVYAVTSRLEIGNFYNMTYRERVEAIVNLLRTEHASLGETLLIDAVAAGSKHVTAGQGLGAAADILAHLDAAVAGYEWRWRMPENHPPFEFWLPDWVHDLIRADRVRTLTAGSTDERFAYADAQIDAWLEARNVNVTWLMDGETNAGQDFGAQPDNAPLAGWPSHVVGYLWHQGAWAFIDGGTIDLGIIRDSVLADTNDLQMFMESFEAALFRGWESLRIDMDVCPSGISQGTASVDFCASGS